MTELLISEIFGPTIQGEGKSIGQTASFIRLGGCNLHCVWCDTPYTWDAARYDLREELTKIDIREIASKITSEGLVVISGGEPLLQPDGLIELIGILVAEGHRIEIETNGTQPPLIGLGRSVSPYVDYNVSPKLAHAGDSRADRINSNLQKFVMIQSAIFKFVVQNQIQLEEVEEIARVYEIDKTRVWIMPEGTDQETHKRIADETLTTVIKRFGWNWTPRLHINYWGDVRGK